jgi:AraC-like DNA-binding protein
MREGEPKRAGRLSAILRLIETSSSDPDLNAVGVARSLGITPRYVHLILEQTGRRFSRHLLEMRLQKAAALLRDPVWQNRRIGDIAAESGFTDLSYFSRAFRRRFDVTPSNMRAGRGS